MTEPLLPTLIPSISPAEDPDRDSVELSANEKRTRLFNVGSPFEVSIAEFDKDWWPLVSNIWTESSNYKAVSGDSFKVYVCRFAKRTKSSSRKEGIPSNKRRKTSSRLADLCSSRIKVFFFFFFFFLSRRVDQYRQP
jgi:hypothetical protein